MVGKRFKKIISHIIAWIVSLILLVPLYIIVVNSLKTRGEALNMSMAFPSVIQWENYTQVIEQGKVFITFFNSCLYAFFSIIVGTLLTAMASFVLSRRSGKGIKILYFFIVLGLTMPVNYVSLMKVMQTLHLLDTRLGICLIYTAMQVSFSVFLTCGFVQNIPRTLDEAAVLDGCSAPRLFFSVIFPLLTPVLVTVAVLNFMAAWNDFITATYMLKSSDCWPMTLAIYSFFGMYEKQWNLVSADIVLTSIPVVLVYLLGQKYIVSGMTAGAVKQ